MITKCKFKFWVFPYPEREPL